MIGKFCIRFHSPQSTYYFSCSESDSMLEELDDSAFCPICFECYSESGDTVSRLLPCTHTMCHACVDKLIKKNTLLCPHDRKAYPAAYGVHTFPQNKYVLKILQQINAGNERKTNLKSQASLLIKQLKLFKSRLVITRKKVTQHRLDLVQN